MDIDSLLTIIQKDSGTLIFTMLGAFLLTGKSILEHRRRDPKDKMEKEEYCLHVLGWVLIYPLIGCVVATAYLANGSMLGAWLALQIGLSSPAIVAALSSSGANILAKDGVHVEDNMLKTNSKNKEN